MSTDRPAGAPEADRPIPQSHRLPTRWRALAIAILILATSVLLYRWVDPLNSRSLDTGPVRTTLEAIVEPAIYDPNSLESLFTLDHCPFWPQQSQLGELSADGGSLICVLANEPTVQDNFEDSDLTFLAIQLAGPEDSVSPFVEGFFQAAGQRDGFRVTESTAEEDVSQAFGQRVLHRCILEVGGRGRICAAWWADNNISVAIVSVDKGATSLQRALIDNLPTFVDLAGRFDPAPHIPD